MAVEEHSTRRRGVGSFPSHWTGFKPGQDSEERAAVIITNMAKDLEARGNHAAAEQVRRDFITGSNPNAPREAPKQFSGSAAEAVDLARRMLAGTATAEDAYAWAMRP